MEPIFSVSWIKTKAKEITGVSPEKTNIISIKNGTIKITLVSCDEAKFEEFKNFIKKNKPYGATVFFENIKISVEHIDFIRNKINIDKETIIKVLVTDFEYLNPIIGSLAVE